MTIKDSPLRGSGRTTSRMLRAIAHALECPGYRVPFTDHDQVMNRTQAFDFADSLKAMAGSLALKLQITVTGSTVYVKSLALKSRKSK